MGEWPYMGVTIHEQTSDRICAEIDRLTNLEF